MEIETQSVNLQVRQRYQIDAEFIFGGQCFFFTPCKLLVCGGILGQLVRGKFKMPRSHVARGHGAHVDSTASVE